MRLLKCDHCEFTEEHIPPRTAPADRQIRRATFSVKGRAKYAADLCEKCWGQILVDLKVRANRPAKITATMPSKSK